MGQPLIDKARTISHIVDGADVNVRRGLTESSTYCVPGDTEQEHSV